MAEFQKTMEELGGKARITGTAASSGGIRPSGARNGVYSPDGRVEVDFPNGHRMDAGGRVVDADYAKMKTRFGDADDELAALYLALCVPAPRAASEIWKDAERDLLGGRAKWTGPDGSAVPCPVGEFSSLAEFALKAAASGALSGPPPSSP